MRLARSRHRDVGASGVRAAVLGAGDGLLTNVSLVLGVAGASPPASTVRLAGLAGLLAGAFSMAAGELVSVRPQEELIEREVEVERQELVDDPRGEETELAALPTLEPTRVLPPVPVTSPLPAGRGSPTRGAPDVARSAACRGSASTGARRRARAPEGPLGEDHALLQTGDLHCSGRRLEAVSFCT
jgi:hypothetical protein